jgi:hypothetical protein
MAASAFRLTQLSGGAEITPANSRFFASPLPVVLHIVGASLYAILGAFQQGAVDGRSLGHQPGRSRMGHPQAAGSRSSSYHSFRSFLKKGF